MKDGGSAKVMIVKKESESDFSVRINGATIELWVKILRWCVYNKFSLKFVGIIFLQHVCGLKKLFR